MTEESIQSFLDALASKSSTPGGGGAAAILGATGAALVSMVCNFTVGKKGYEDVSDELAAILERSEELRGQLTSGVADDVRVFDQVMAAYGMPRGTDDEKAARSSAIQDALKAATKVPLTCAKQAREVIDLSRAAAEKGNRNVISDAGVAVVAAQAALKSAALNVYINTGSIKDKDFAEAKLAELNALLDGADFACDEIYGIVKSKL